MKTVLHNNNDLTYIFSSLVLLLILVPIGHTNEYLRYLINIIFTFMIVEIMYHNILKKTVTKILVIIASSSVVLLWISSFYSEPEADIIYAFSHLLFYIYLSYVLTHRVLESKVFNNNTILGSLSIYISVAFGWGYLFAIVKIVDPTSFGSAYAIGDAQAIESMIYFSFISITTLGYGDIYPTSPIAGSFVILEVMFGQIFFAVVIAKIVSLSLISHLNRSVKKVE
ncbi:MAG: hypothetical protein GQ570_05305 [Helicobacteraceae bacterium]|nr:hypothetical protein [Helicobacteraceae bacterium]